MANHSIYDGVVPDLVALLRQVTLCINDGEGHRTSHPPEAIRVRSEIRRIVVESLNLLPLRDQVELVQIVQCLSEVVNTTNELNEATILCAVDLLKDITAQATALLENSGQGMNFDLDPRVLTLAVRTVSNMMLALAGSDTLFAQTGRREVFYRNIANGVTALVQDLMALQLQVDSVGEVPIQVSSPFLSLHALHLLTGQQQSVTLPDSQFHLPNATTQLIQQWSPSSHLSQQSLLTPSLPQSLSSAGLNKDERSSVPSKEDSSTYQPHDAREADSPRKSRKGLKELQNLTGRKGKTQRPEYFEDHQCFQSRAMSFLSDPFSLIPENSGNVQTAVTSLDLYSCDGSEQLQVKDLPQSNLVKIDIQRQLPENSKFGSSHYLNKTNMNVHELLISQKSLYQYQAGEDDETLENRFLHLHINIESVPLGMAAFPIMVIVSPVSVPYLIHGHIFKEVYNQSVRDIKIILPASSIEAGKTYSVGIAEASFNSGRRRNIEVRGQSYNLSVWWDSCVYWNKKEEAWRNDGCHVLDSSTLQVLHCSCNHLTSFAGFFSLVEHRLTVVSVNEFFSPHENPLIVVVVGIVLLSYLVLVLMMQPTMKSDEDVKRKGRLVFSQDNCSFHRQKYEVVMETGFHPDAGTTSKISLILHGDEGISETRELTTTDNVLLFERNSRNRFIISYPESLGRIVKIQLWHNNWGSSPGWFLRQAMVRDLNSGLTFYFMCQRWMAVDRDDGKVEREFSTLDGSEITFSQVFMCKASQYLSDLHTWLSAFTCPPHSCFTRIQRLFLCLALLLSYMGLATLWFHMSPPTIRGEFALLDLSWRNIVTGTVICCMMFPVNLLTAFLFRRSCVNNKSIKTSEDLGRKSGLDLTSQGEDEMQQSSVPYSILDQSILNWQHIQEWAQRQWQKRQSHGITSLDPVKDGQANMRHSSPSVIPLVQQTMLAGEEDTELGSSGFEDATSQATAERHRIVATSDTSSLRKKTESEPSTAPINTKRKVLLPWWCRYFAWILCLFLIGSGATLTVWYGFRFSRRRSVMWIQSVYFSFIFDFFILQPAVSFLKALCISIRHCHNPAVFDMDSEDEEDLDLEWEERRRQEVNTWQEEDEMQRGLAARSRSRYLRFAGPLQEKQLKSSRRKMLQEKKALSLLRNGFLVKFLTLLILIVAFGRSGSYQAHLNHAIHQMFTGEWEDNPSFMNISSIQDWHDWSKKTMVPSLTSLGTLLDQKQKNSASELGVIIGNVRLRKLSVRPEQCVTTQPLRTRYARCFHDYSDSLEDTSYSQLKTSHFEGHLGIWGYLAWYKNAGHVFSLNLSRDEMLDHLNFLESSHWLNPQTRAVFVEMTVYNPPSRFYSSVILLLELSATGLVIPSIHIRSSQLFHYVTVWDNCLLACELIILATIIVMVSLVARKLFHLRSSYFLHFWNYIELLMSLTSMLYILMFTYRFVLVMEIVESLRSTFYEEFVSLSFLTLWDEILRILLGLMLFCVLLKWIYGICYNPTVARFLSVYKRSKREILVAAGLFAGQVLAFTSMGHALFASVYQPMSSLVSCAMTVTALSVRILSSSEAIDSHSSYYISIFCVFSYVFLHGLVSIYLLSVFTHRLKNTKIRKRLYMPPKKLLKFYWFYLCKKTNSKKDTQSQESDNVLSPEFIMAEILYLVEELLFRMNNLLGTSGLPEKQHSFTDSDSTQDPGDDGISTGGSEELQMIQPPDDTDQADTTELTRLEDRVHRIEDKLCSNEPYLAQLLKLDSFGANILSEEEEQDLRSQLEFEIFQQLQKQRQEITEIDQPIFSLQSKSKLELPKVSSALPLPHHEFKDGSVCKITMSKNTMKQLSTPDPVSSAMHSIKSQNEIENPYSVLEGEMKTPKIHSTVVNSNSKSLKRSQSLKVPVRDTTGTFDIPQGTKKTKQGHLCEKDNDSNLQARLLVNRHSSVKGKKEMMAFDRFGKKDLKLTPTSSILRKPGLKAGESGEREKDFLSMSHKMSSGNVSPQSSEGERGHKRTDSSSGQSGVDNRQDTPKMVGKRLDLPPKPTFTHNSILSPPKVRPLDLMGEWTAAESSSGSEQEAGLVSKRMCVGRRNLRKTKSRGKGKGNDVDIDSAIVLTEDLHSSSHRGISDCSIIIHPIPAHVDLDEISIPEEV